MPNHSRTPALTMLASAALALSACSATRTQKSAGEQHNDTVVTTTVKVKAALAANSDTKAHQINVATANGVVQLRGFVNSPASRNAASEAARGFGGVKSVRSELDVK